MRLPLVAIALLLVASFAVATDPETTIVATGGGRDGTWIAVTIPPGATFVTLRTAGHQDGNYAYSGFWHYVDGELRFSSILSISTFDASADVHALDTRLATADGPTFMYTPGGAGFDIRCNGCEPRERTVVMASAGWSGEWTFELRSADPPELAPKVRWGEEAWLLTAKDFDDVAGAEAYAALAGVRAAVGEVQIDSAGPLLGWFGSSFLDPHAGTMSASGRPGVNECPCALREIAGDQAWGLGTPSVFSWTGAGAGSPAGAALFVASVELP